LTVCFLLMYTRVQISARVGVVTLHPLQSTIPLSGARVGAEFVSIQRDVA
jgi:hypothetical protein